MATIHVYTNTLNRVKEFAAYYRDKIDFENITLDFWQRITYQVTQSLRLTEDK
jgi:hypothetical protein